MIIKRWYPKIIHTLIFKYLVSCGGAFHHNKYGLNGRYIVLMDEHQYNKYTNLVGTDRW